MEHMTLIVSTVDGTLLR